LILVTSITVGCGSGGGGPADGAAHDGPPADGRPTVDAAPPCDGWLLEDVAPSALAAFKLGLAIESDGAPHITYYGAEGNISVATRRESWLPEVIAPVGMLAPSSSTAVAFDATGRVHVVWGERAGAYYATRAGASGAWMVEPIEETAPAYTGAVMLDLAQDGSPHVAYDVLAQGVKHAARVGSTWEIEWVISDSDFSVRGVRVDAAGHVHLAMHETNVAEPWYATDASASWQAEVLDPASGQFAGGVALAITEVGEPHIVYSHTMGDLRLITGMPGNWQAQILDMDSSLGGSVAVEFAPDGALHAAYNVRDEALVVGTGEVGSWTREVVDPVPRAISTALEISSDGTAHLAYYDLDRQMVRYARGCTP
jgi:hypothetical protein